MGSFPYHSHIFRDSYGSGMGIVWEAYHKGVPLLRVPGITVDCDNQQFKDKEKVLGFPAGSNRNDR